MLAPSFSHSTPTQPYVICLFDIVKIMGTIISNDDGDQQSQCVCVCVNKMMFGVYDNVTKDGW